MISMSQAYSIRQLRQQGNSISEISRKCDVSRNTVYKYLEKTDFSEDIPKRKRGSSLLDDYKSTIESWLDEDAKNWRKQRHTAHRIWVRLTEEFGLACSESTVRNYVRRLKIARGEQKEQFLDLDWPPGEAQADFGEADFYVLGIKRRLSYFVMSFPYSNIGFAQVFPAENAECVCQGLKNIFEFIGGIPLRIVFDNATGIGRRTMEKVRLTGLFSAFAAHYNFAYAFCNPEAGHEKGNVEGKVGFIRRNAFTPPPRIDNIGSYNTRLLGECMNLAKIHYAKGEPEDQLFVEDRIALQGLPDTPFNVVRYERRRADLQGKVTLCGKHKYPSAPDFAKQELICALYAATVEIYTSDGMLIATHARQYGDAPTDTCNPASQLTLLIRKPGGWVNSKVRFALPDDLREHMDSLDKASLRDKLRLMRSVADEAGWDKTVEAMDLSLSKCGRIDSASVLLGARAMASSPIVYDQPVDLSVYDAAIGGRVMAHGA